MRKYMGIQKDTWDIEKESLGEQDFIKRMSKKGGRGNGEGEITKIHFVQSVMVVSNITYAN